MNLKISKPWALVLAFTVLTSVALFLFFLARFGGPALHLSEPYKLTAAFPDTRGLSVRSEVLVRGVHVGEVDKISIGADKAEVTISVDDEYAPLGKGLKLGVGQKTLFGEAYVDLTPAGPDAPGIPAGTTLAGSSVLDPTPDIDQALDVLDESGRRHLTGLLGTLSRGAAAPDSTEQVNASMAELSRAASDLRSLTDTLAGQESQIAGGVTDGRTVLATLAEREASLRTIVSAGRTTLEQTSAHPDQLREGIRELPELLSSARETLRDARPLLIEAQPLAEDLNRAADPLNDALVDLPPTVEDANALIASLPELSAVAPPFLHKASRTLRTARPALHPLSNALRNIVAPSRFLSARKQAFAAWFSNTGDLGSSRDAKGYFARFFLSFGPATTFGLPSDFQTNAYTGPGDALANQPYSGYPRLMPFDPPSLRSKDSR